MGGSNTGYSLDKYDRLAGKLYNGMKTRSIRRGHDLKLTAREFQLWCKEQPGYLENCDKWFEDGKQAYSDLKPSCNRLDDNEAYSFDNMEMITWGEHKAKTIRDGKDGSGNATGYIAIHIYNEGNLVFEACSIAEAVRYVAPHLTKTRQISGATSNIRGAARCTSRGVHKVLYGHSYRFN